MVYKKYQIKKREKTRNRARQSGQYIKNNNNKETNNQAGKAHSKTWQWLNSRKVEDRNRGDNFGCSRPGLKNIGIQTEN